MNDKISAVTLVLLMPLCIATILASGCGGGGGSGGPAGDGTPPSISDSSATLSADFSFEGGLVSLQANVTDDRAVRAVEATISTSGTAVATAPLAHDAGDGYSASYNAPGNATSTSVTYSVVFTATDTSGNRTQCSPISFDVPAASSPPLPQPPPDL